MDALALPWLALFTAGVVMRVRDPEFRREGRNAWSDVPEMMSTHDQRRMESAVDAVVLRLSRDGGLLISAFDSRRSGLYIPSRFSNGVRHAART